MLKNLHGIRGKADEGAYLNVVERLDAEGIDGTEKAPPAGVPDCECEVAEEVVGAGHSPFGNKPPKSSPTSEVADPSAGSSWAMSSGRLSSRPSRTDADLTLRIEDRLIRSGGPGVEGQVGEPRLAQEAVADSTGSSIGGGLHDAPEIFRLDARGREVHNAEETAHPLIRSSSAPGEPGRILISREKPRCR